MTPPFDLGPLQTTLHNPTSFHPTLSLTLARPPSSSSSSSSSFAPSSERCEANLLVHLPSGVFYDPYTARNPIVGGGGARRTTTTTTRSSGGDAGSVVSSGKVELEHAVGWTGRTVRDRGGSRQWWEREAEAGPGEVDLQDVFAAALRQTAQQVVAEEEQRQHPIRVSLDSTQARVRVKNAQTQETHKGKGQRQQFRDERSTVVIPLHVDDLLRADGGLCRVDVPLHVRYHPPREARAARAESNTSAAARLLRELIPARLARAYHQMLTHYGGSSAPAPPLERNQHAKLILPPPQLYISCPSPSTNPSPASLLPPSHAHLKSHLTTHLAASSSTTHEKKYVVAQTRASKTGGGGTVELHVPIPDAEWLPPVQATTMITVVGAAAAVVYHLLVKIVPALEGVEKLDRD